MKSLLACLLAALISRNALAAIPTLKLSWQPVTTMSDGTPIASGTQVSYNVYGGHTLTGPFSLATNVTTTTAIRSNVDVGVDCYRITAVVNGVESDPTPVICVTVTQTVSTVPSSPLNLVLTQTQ